MNVLFVSHSLPPADEPLANVGGMQRVATELDTALAGRTDITYASFVLRSRWSSHYRKLPGFAWRLFRHLRSRCRKRDVDVVLFSSMVTAALMLFLRGRFDRAGMKAVAVAHGRDVTVKNPLYQWLLPRLFRSLDQVIAVSRATAAACAVRGMPRSRLTIIPNGVDPNRFPKPVFGRNGERSKLSRLTNGGPLPQDAFVVCSVGRQVERKGFAWFVANVLPTVPNDVHYVLAGDGPEGETIRAAARENNVTDRVHLLGRISEEDLNLLYRAADLFVMPNVPVDGDMEGFGVVMLEAGLSGLPTVASRLEGIRDVIREGENGVLVRAKDSRDFADSLLHFYKNRAHLEQTARRAYAYTAARFSWPGVSEMYVNTLRELVDRDAAG